MKYIWLVGERDNPVFFDLDPRRTVERDPQNKRRLIDPQTKEEVGVIDQATGLIHDAQGQIIGIER